MKRTTTYTFADAELKSILHEELIRKGIISRGGSEPILIKFDIFEAKITYRDELFELTEEGE